MEEAQASGVLVVRLVLTSFALILVGLGVGWGIFSIGLGGTPKLAVLDGPLDVIDGRLTNAVKAKLAFAADDPDIKAVVVRIDSPGGSASASEELYSELTKLREVKPVVVTIQGVAASGAYFMAVGANEIFAGPSTIVGSIGALLSPPGPEIPSEFTQSTGPFKLTGGSERTYIELLEKVKEGFYATVLAERVERLAAPKEIVASGRIWLGLEAVQLGLIDQLGDETDAIRRAAELAGLHRFDLISVEEEMVEEGGRLAQAVSIAEEFRAQGDFNFDTSDSKFPYIHFLYLPPQ